MIIQFDRDKLEKILVIDDDATIKTIFSFYLPERNIIYFNNGKDAIDYLENNINISFIFIDLMLPNVEFQGKNLVRKIREISPFTTISIITSYYSYFSLLEVEDCGADYYVPKPLKKHILKAIIENRAYEVKDELLPSPLEETYKKGLIEIDESWCRNSYSTEIWEEAKNDLETYRSGYVLPESEEK